MKTGPTALGLELSPAAFIRRLAGGVFLINLFVVVLVSLMLHRSYHGRLDRAAMNTQNLAQVLEENIASDIDKIDIALLSAADDVTRQFSAGGIDGRTINAFLVRQKSRLPDAESIRMTDSQGIVKYGPGVAPGSRVDLSDRDFFIRTRDDPAAGLLISKPVLARISKKWVLPIARRLNRPDGSFVGVVYANIALDRLTRMFSGVDIGKHGAIALFDSDRAVVVRYPEPGGLGSSVGKKFISPQIQRLFQAGREAATYDGRSSIDGLERTFSYRKVSGYPLYVSVGLSKDDYLAGWRDEATETAALAALFPLISLLSAWVIYRSWKSQLTASRSLQESGERLNLALAASKMGAWEWDIRTDAVFWSPECYEIIGGKDFGGKLESFTEMLHPEDSGRVMATARKAVAERTVYEAEFRIIRPGGEVRWVSNMGRAKYDEAGRPLKLVGTVRDITESKRAAEALLSSEQKYRALIETTNTGYVILDTMGNVLDANPEYAKQTGHTTPEEIVGRNVVEWTAEGDRERNAEEVKKCLESGFVRNLAINYIGRDGTITPVEINATVIRDTDRTTILGLCRNIAGRKKMETEIIKAQKLESVGILAGGIAHDFNNLLQSIIGNVGLAKMDAKAGDKIFERLNEAEKAAEQATELSYRLLTFAKGGEPIRKVTAIDKLIRESLSLSLSGSNITGGIDLPDDLYVEIDEGQIRQVFNNLFINAKEAMPDGGTIRVTGRKITVSEDDGLPLQKGLYLKISVEDSGVGIPEKNLPMIFDPYFSTKGLGSDKGTGLGLAVCHSVIKKHAGHIGVESQVGKGTTFHVYLAVSKGVSPGKAAEKDGLHMSKGRLLLMDDDERILTVAGEMLEYLGYEVDCVKNGKEAIKKYRTAKESGTRYEAVILDLTVPGGMGGEKALMGLLEVDPAVKAVISSGYAGDHIMKDFGAYGFSAAISKPYTIERLAGMLERI